MSRTDQCSLADGSITLVVDGRIDPAEWADVVVWLGAVAGKLERSMRLREPGQALCARPTTTTVVVAPQGAQRCAEERPGAQKHADAGKAAASETNVKKPMRPDAQAISEGVIAAAAPGETSEPHADSRPLTRIHADARPGAQERADDDTGNVPVGPGKAAAAKPSRPWRRMKPVPLPAVPRIASPAVEPAEPDPDDDGDEVAPPVARDSYRGRRLTPFESRVVASMRGSDRAFTTAQPTGDGFHYQQVASVLSQLRKKGIVESFDDEDGRRVHRLVASRAGETSDA